jgi:putative hydrolase of the HAD superfamily
VTDLVSIDAKVIVFDMDDTLYLERDFARSGFRAAAREFSDRIERDRFAQQCCDLLDSGARGNIFDLALRRLGMASDGDLIDQLVARYRSHTPEISLCPDAERFLERIGSVQTGLISDGPGNTQATKVAALGLGERIDHIVLTGEWPEGFGKPHPRAFELVQELTGYTGSSLLYIADNAAKDFLAPNQLGWQSVQILREGRIHSGVPVSADYAAARSVETFDQIIIGTSHRPA